MTHRTIDLSADLGEDPCSLAAGVDGRIMRYVTSANVACGGHAGDAEMMDAVVRIAVKRGVAVGAHPSYPDRANFGRVALALAPADLEAAVAQQIRALGDVARAHGVALTHVKPHGALYHAAGGDVAIAAVIARAAARWSRALVLVAQAGSAALAAWRDLGFAVAAEAFVDRRYEPDGRLRDRSRHGALLTDEPAVRAQALRLALGEGALAEDGTVVPARCDTLCLHADTPHAVDIARTVREHLTANGVAVNAWSARAPRAGTPPA
jgi:5-oxoprolinase (ATP-hydrolysing) subunit A